MIWLTSAWAWLKKWWKWLALPVGAALWVLGRATARKQIVVSSPELQGHAELETQWGEVVAQKRIEATAAKEARDRDIVTGYENTVASSQKEAQKKAVELQDNPEALNDYLKKVGKNVRGEQKS